MNSYCPECDRTFELSAGVCPFDETELEPADEEDDPFLGTVLDDRYRLEARLGGGGMGVVYRARQLAVDRDVAVKVLHSETDDPAGAHHRFTQEARHISALSHPNVVQLIDFGRDGNLDIWFLVMEHVEGESLRALLSRGPVEWELALEVVYQVCAALSESHQRETIHRDLKPSNLHLKPVADGTLQVKVLDFGIARCVERAGKLSGSGKICGSPAYMAPEQAQGEDVGPAADFYALGVILYEMLTHELPFDADGPMQYMYKTSTREFPDLSEHLPASEYREYLQGLLELVVEKEPEDRPDEARVVREHIETIREELDLPLHRLGTDIRDVRHLYEFVRTDEAEPPARELAVAGDGMVSSTMVTQAFPTLDVTADGVESPDTVDILPASGVEAAESPPEVPDEARSRTETAGLRATADMPPSRSDTSSRAASSSNGLETTIVGAGGVRGRLKWIVAGAVLLGGGLVGLVFAGGSDGRGTASVDSRPSGRVETSEEESESEETMTFRGTSQAPADEQSSGNSDAGTGARGGANHGEAAERSGDAGREQKKGSGSRQRRERAAHRPESAAARAETERGSGGDDPGRRREERGANEGSAGEEASSDSLRQMLKNGTLREER